MLDPAAIDGMAEAVAGIYSDAEQQLIARIASSLQRGLGTPQWAAQQLLTVNALAETARGDLLELLPEVQALLQQFLSEAVLAGEAAAAVDLGAEALKTAGGGVMSAAPVVSEAAVSALAAETVAVVADSHRAILRNVVDGYRTIVAEVAGRTVTGTDTTHGILQQALNKFAAAGIRGFEDRAGRRWQMDSYAEMATRTATMRALAQGHSAKLKAAGRDLVVVSQHANSAPQCAPYQGQILSLSGATKGTIVETNRLTGRPITVHVFASMDDAERAGLHHPNCGHRHTLYVPGAPRPKIEPYDPQKYKDGQKLRYLERRVRAAKRAEAAAITPEGKAQARALVRHRQGLIRDHVDATGTPRRRYREQLRTGKADQAGGPVQLNPRTPTPTPDAPSAAPFDHITDIDELTAETERIIEAGDFDMLDALEARQAVLMAEAAKREAANAKAREKRAAATEAKREAQNAEHDRLLAEGMDWELATEKAFGITVEQQRRENAINSLRRQGHQGAGFDEVTRNAHTARVYEEWLAAENELTFLVKKRYEADVDPRDLWKMNEETATKYATDELKEWWDINGRTTLEGFRAEWLGGTQGNTRGGDFLQ